MFYSYEKIQRILFRLFFTGQSVRSKPETATGLFFAIFSLGMGHYILNASHSAIICMTCSLSNVPFATRFL